MKSKMDVQSCFKHYKERKERQTGKVIKAMRFDGGSEYKSIEFNGIIQQISTPYTQHQNGVSERLNRSLITMVRCMLSHAHLPLRFWDAAVLTACYLRNRLPICQGKLTPYEVMNACSPKISHLKVWGCVCYALINVKDPHRFKLSPTSYKGIFIGYCESSTQYRIYVPSKQGPNKVIISANVRFLEDTFWDWTDQSSETLGGIEELTAVYPKPSEPGPSEPGVELSTPSESDSNSPLQSPYIPSSVISPIESSYTPGVEAPNEDISNIQDLSINQPEVETSNQNNIASSTSDANIDNNLRRSSRIRKPIGPRSAWQPSLHALQMDTDTTIPQTYTEAVNGSNSDQWKMAIEEELSSLRDKKVFTPVIHVPCGRKPVGSRWVFSIKSDGRFKARLVAQGFSQVYGVDYNETYSPTLRADSLRILLAVAAYRDWDIHQIDVKTAYLEGDLHEEIYMKAPEGISGTSHVRVDKALYGLKQSGRVWYEKLDDKLLSLGFKKIRI